ncbi:MAG: metalloregulator ArsR/SmtB family transcription factor [candidate division Zixibacteria bacterium]|nr:metalloregulator ArsR/SmtB family transcription factor [candidate division Zixibacteria bacterium]
MSNYRTIEVERFSEMFGALSNPNRLIIFLRLINCCGLEKPCSTDAGMGACVGELSDGLGIAPSTVSHHLKELRRTGLISMSRQGRTVECTINVKTLEGLLSLFDAQQQQIIQL